MIARLRANPERAAEAELFERGLVSEIVGKANLTGGDLTAKLFGRSQMSKLRAAGVPEFRIREIEDVMRVERMMGRLRKDATAAPSKAASASRRLCRSCSAAATSSETASSAESLLPLSSKALLDDHAAASAAERGSASAAAPAAIPAPPTTTSTPTPWPASTTHAPCP
jgi:hypothetical protein